MTTMSPFFTVVPAARKLSLTRPLSASLMLLLMTPLSRLALSMAAIPVSAESTVVTLQKEEPTLETQPTTPLLVMTGLFRRTPAREPLSTVKL